MGEYSVENAGRFHWSSATGRLDGGRLGYLEKYLVGEKILDAGCDGGGYVEWLAEKGLAVTGVDRYGEFLELARERGRRGSYVQGDLINLPFENKAFDSTFCYDVLEHIDDRRAIRELARVTRRRLIVSVPREDDILAGRFGLTFFHYRDRTHLREYSEESLGELLAQVTLAKPLIKGELPVNLAGLATELARFEPIDLDLRILARLHWLKYLLQRRLRVSRSEAAALYVRANEHLFAKLLASARFAPLDTTLVAIVDLG